MYMDQSNPHDVALAIFNLIEGLEIKYGKARIAGVLHGSELRNPRFAHLHENPYFGSLYAYSLEHIRDFIEQLFQQGYMHTVYMGQNYALPVLELTGKGLYALRNTTEISLTLPPIHLPTFEEASKVIASQVLQDYYDVKKKLVELQKQEERLKEQIKATMLEKHLSKITTATMDLFCRTYERIFYSKEKIETFVPEDIREKIREIKTTTSLTARIKK